MTARVFEAAGVAGGCASALASHTAVALRALWSPEECASLSASVLAARDAWTSDFDGEQFSLGRAFYTHLETGRAGEYFAHVREADATVERTLPGMQARARDLFASIIGGAARPRPGFCGAGVHVFPARSKVARRGGVPHWDVEGLAPEHLARRRRTATLVVMLQAPEEGGALRVWDALWDGRDEPSRAALRADSCDVRYAAGDAVLIESYRLHQIQPFTGARDRISVTLHGVEVDRDRWEVWF